ncbi:MAG: hypothetical protein U0934_18470 [Pseudotabrizicola sp.]|uniref:hypothetical protein n=1 Tax=Pseudotabrizicola sp. TaxID=2939647 RepID=UPI002715EED0|nr:hypothetical protein [Pseudotabrizicola sp.]MDO8885061.1 hypothetical protein [Pseudotabrizicola sp.]MDP2083289.1 hypothetical protein [Pseudotabrizicola sp.]MDZ7575908.1 hypothetical protein [Pseudotabrizicola sp.]
MPLPLAPLFPFVLRIGAVAALGFFAQRLIRRHGQIGRTDHRAEEALDDLGEGLTSHRPRDVAGQRNVSFRLRRTIRFGGKIYELDAGAMARLRLRETE